MIYLCITGFALFAIALFFLVLQEVRHHNHVVEMKAWADECLALHASLIEQLTEDTDIIENLRIREHSLEVMRDYLIAANEEIYQGYIDAARTVANMEASVTLLDELLTQAEDAGIANAKRILNGIEIGDADVFMPDTEWSDHQVLDAATAAFKPQFVDDTEEINPDVPVDYYLPDQDQG